MPTVDYNVPTQLCKRLDIQQFSSSRQVREHKVCSNLPRPTLSRHLSVSSFPFPISYFLVPTFRATPSPRRMDLGEHIFVWSLRRMVLGRHGSASLCRVERENKMAATYNVLAFKR